MPILTRAVYKSVKEFAEYYGLKLSYAYELANREDFPSKKMGSKIIRVDMTKTDEFFDKHFN